MFFNDKPGWGIAFRILMVVLLVVGIAALSRYAFYRGYSAGVSTGPDGMVFSRFHDTDGPMVFHCKPGYMPHQVYPGSMHNQGYPGGMHYPSMVGFGGSGLHILFGILGFFLLAKLIMGGRRMYHRGPGYYGHHRYHPHHGQHHCECDCCREDQVKEEPETKPSKSKK